MGYLSTSCLRYPLVIFLIVSIHLTDVYASGMVFNVTMKPKVVSKFGRQLSDTHGPTPMDFHLGGTWTYFTELSIGEPPQHFIVQIDTGSDITWLNCQNCKGCAIDDDELGVHLKPYNPEASKTAEIVKEGKQFCTAQANPNSPCTYNISYIDGTVLSGYYVRDYLNYNSVTGNNQTQIGRTKFAFGCTMEESSETNKNNLKRGINGLLGLGSFSTTLLSQMSESGSARNVFSICLDKRRGGGIFAVGKVVNPKVKMVPNLDKYGIGAYSLAIQSMAFGDDVIELKGTPTGILDSGADVAMLPKAVQVALANLISKKLQAIPVPYFNFHCFLFEKELSESYIDTVLPTLTFKFSNTASLSVAPHSYFGRDGESNRYCIITNHHEYDDLILLGAPFLSEHLIVYDNENKSIGMMDYDCTSSVEVEDDSTGEAFDVDSHVLESGV